MVRQVALRAFGDQGSTWSVFSIEPGRPIELRDSVRSSLLGYADVSQFSDTYKDQIESDRLKLARMPAPPPGYPWGSG